MVMQLEFTKIAGVRKLTLPLGVDCVMMMRSAAAIISRQDTAVWFGVAR